jgi:hypothetical protein
VQHPLSCATIVDGGSHAWRPILARCSAKADERTCGAFDPEETSEVHRQETANVVFAHIYEPTACRGRSSTITAATSFNIRQNRSAVV